MRASFLAVVTSAVVVLVSLSETRTRPALHPDSLARVEAISSYCGKIDPGSIAEYAGKLESLTRGYSTGEIDSRRTTAKYRDAMDEANATLARASYSTAVNGCTEFLAEKQ